MIPGTSPRKTDADSANYDLLCGQGRIEAFIQPATVIIRYPGSVQLATGGTVVITGGYVIHTFTSSGTFTVN